MEEINSSGRGENLMTDNVTDDLLQFKQKAKGNDSYKPVTKDEKEMIKKTALILYISHVHSVFNRSTRKNKI